MKKQIIFSIFSIAIVAISCKKDSIKAVPAVALNVVNAALDVPSMNVNFTLNPIPYFQYQGGIKYGKIYEWTVQPGNNPIDIVSSLDTTGSIYKANLNFRAQGIYSLYVLSGSGSGGSNVLLMQDTIPVHKDSTAGVRFINLSFDKNPLTVDEDGTTIVEFGPLSYKQITPFKSYNPSILYDPYDAYFDVYDPVTGKLLCYADWNYQLFTNVTFVIIGSDAVGYQAIEVNNY